MSAESEMNEAAAANLNCDESLISDERLGPADASPDKSLKTRDAAALLVMLSQSSALAPEGPENQAPHTAMDGSDDYKMESDNQGPVATGAYSAPSVQTGASLQQQRAQLQTQQLLLQMQVQAAQMHLPQQLQTQQPYLQHNDPTNRSSQSKRAVVKVSRLPELNCVPVILSRDLFDCVHWANAAVISGPDEESCGNLHDTSSFTCRSIACFVAAPAKDAGTLQNVLSWFARSGGLPIGTRAFVSKRL